MCLLVLVLPSLEQSKKTVAEDGAWVLEETPGWIGVYTWKAVQD